MKFHQIKKYTSLRWLLLGAGVIAIIGLTGMNVYSLYALHKNTIESEKENKKNELVEFTYQVRNRFYTAFYGLAKLNMDRLDQSLRKSDRFPDKFKAVIQKGARDSLYKAIYYTPGDHAPCTDQQPIFKFDETQNHFVKTSQYPELVCDGVGMAKTRMKVLIDEYKWNNKLFFDTHRSMTIALINLYNQTVIGYLTFVVNQDYLVHDYLQPLLEKTFRKSSESGVVVWLDNWTKNKILASSDPSVKFDHDMAGIRQKFPDLLGNWNLKMTFTESPAISASRASLYRNLTVLGAAVLLLLGALVFMFVTAQKERDLAMRQAGFLANVTHELKTPLAVMQAAGENLADGRVQEESRLRSYGQHIYSESVRLRSMIEKLLDVAKADAQQVKVSQTPCALNSLIREYIENHKDYISGKGFTIDLDLPEKSPVVMMDEDHFETIINNLVENALKYSKEDKYLGISLTPNNDEVKLAISDHGVGIPRKAQKYIFDKFYRVEDTLTAKTKGHGLGLSIVRNLVQINGGTIDVDSRVGEGTTFILHFPTVAESKLEENIQKKSVYSYGTNQ